MLSTEIIAFLKLLGNFMPNYWINQEKLKFVFGIKGNAK